MSKLNVDQQTVFELLSHKNADFLIPDYQRPYAWTEDECATLWDDIVSFTIPDEDATAFDTNEEYFLGPIVTFRNDVNQLEVIDGQQRLTTLLLLLRALYDSFGSQQDQPTKTTQRRIEQCIWKTDEFDNPDKDQLKIDSEVATDDDKQQFLHILKTGEAKISDKSRYAQTFRFFQERINEFKEKYPVYLANLSMRLMTNVILLPIEAESQDTALRIFSTLNDRGKPLADADIFKSQFYNHYSAKSEKDDFIRRWRRLEEISSEIFPQRHSPMDELFTRYMYYERALQGNRKTTTQSLRDFYEKNSYSLLRRDETLDNLESLLEFWQRIEKRQGFTEEVLRLLFVLNYAPNSMWTYFLSVYFLHHRDEQDNLDEEKLAKFLGKMTAFIWGYAVHNPGVNQLRSPVFAEMINLVNDKEVTFEGYKFNAEQLERKFNSYDFTNNRPVTKSMLVWWAFRNPKQEILDVSTRLQSEHIYSVKRAQVENTLATPRSLELLGNKAFLEEGINIRASDYRFEDKKRYYVGFEDSRGKKRSGTANVELVEMAKTRADFTEKDIKQRDTEIIHSFLDYLKENNLLKR